MSTDWRDDIACPEVKWLFQQRSMFDRTLLRAESDEGLPVYEVQAAVLSPTWQLRLEFGYVFDPERLRWDLAVHESAQSGLGGQGILEVARMGPMIWYCRVGENQVKALVSAKSMTAVRALAKGLVNSQFPGNDF